MKYINFKTYNFKPSAQPPIRDFVPITPSYFALEKAPSKNNLAYNILSSTGYVGFYTCTQRTKEREQFELRHKKCADRCGLSLDGVNLKSTL